MKKLFFVFCLFLFGSGIAFGESLDAMANKFYKGLVPIIEKNMNNPSRCVSEVNSYYSKNQALLGEIRKGMEKSMEHISPMMDKYMGAMSGNQQDLEELKKYGNSAAVQSYKQKAPSATMKRYSDALEKFTQKYPSAGAQVAMKAFELMPKSKGSMSGF